MTIFTKIINRDIPAHIVYEDDSVIAFLDISQTTKGHTLVVPKKEVTNFLECDPETQIRINEVIKHLAHKIMKNLGAKGFNVLTNMNEVAGQTVFHYHVHLIPRYDESDSITIKFKANEFDLNQIKEEIVKG